jgi:hypothetical protein
MRRGESLPPEATQNAGADRGEGRFDWFLTRSQIGGVVSVSGGSASGIAGTSGLARLEAFTITAGTNSLTSLPYGLALPTGGSSNLTVSSVNGVTINANPFTFPDTTVNTGSAVAVIISGTFIPPNTTGKLNIFSETGADQSISFTLTGTFQSTTGSRGFAKVTWTTPECLAFPAFKP